MHNEAIGVGVHPHSLSSVSYHECCTTGPMPANIFLQNFVPPAVSPAPGFDKDELDKLMAVGCTFSSSAIKFIFVQCQTLGLVTQQEEQSSEGRYSLA